MSNLNSSIIWLSNILEFAIQTDSISSTLTFKLFKKALIFAISSSNDWNLQKKYKNLLNFEVNIQLEISPQFWMPLKFMRL